MSKHDPNGSPRNGAGSREKPFSERLDESLATLAELRMSLRARRGRRDVATDREPLTELVGSLYGVVASLERVLQAQPHHSSPSEHLSTFNAASMARALLITGCRYEPAVLQVMREYRTAFDNVRRYAQVALPAEIKSDLVARFRQQLDSAQQTLEVLQVEPFVPEPGSRVDATRLRVLKTIPNTDPELAETVVEVLSPGFAWRDDQGNRRIEPADVIVFGPASGDTPRTAPDHGGRRPPTRWTSPVLGESGRRADEGGTP